MIKPGSFFVGSMTSKDDVGWLVGWLLWFVGHRRL